ncbi:unnamed protein product [Thelazia callipaeda]|uniref:Kin17_mid domain-containing protein n=1 Tax=Thelazia callipaeda TaxID=103827 RepID=A0A0N5CR06_THECL|nr:unnamed protein product [Thelazia callipaeda]
MGKYEKGTPKEIANRCKSKGLQKLRWFCQMCKKQCRDQNGFKCHLTSETHQRQLLLFAENPGTYLEEYSREFERNFLKVLRSTFGTKRVRANEVYQEYIRDKLHTHMNSTKWHTLTNFVIYLGEAGICRVDQTERGWYIAWIDQEEELRKQAALHKVKAAYDDEHKQQQLLREQAERAREKQQQSVEEKTSGPTELIRSSNEEKIIFSLAGNKSDDVDVNQASSSMPTISHSVFSRKIKEEIKYEEDTTKKSREYSDRKQEVRPRRTALDEIMEMEEQRKEKQNRKDNWLHEKIIVKVMTKKFGNDFYKAKGVIRQVVDDFTAILDVNGHSLEVGQENLETVIPAVGREMLVVNGAYRGTKAILQAIKEDEFSLVLLLNEGCAKGRVISLPYEDASKLER